MVARSCTALVALCFLGTNVWADIESGPKSGTKVSGFKVIVPSSDADEKTENFLESRKDKPTIFVFIDAERFDRPTARCLRKLDEDLPESTGADTVIAVWLSKDLNETKERLPRFKQSLKPNRTVYSVFETESASPDGWDINSNALATVVVVASGKVSASFGFDSFNETDADKILEAWKKATAAKPAEKKAKKEKKQPGEKKKEKKDKQRG